MKKATLLLIILLCIATLCGCNEALTESLPESEAVSQTVSEVSENGNNDEVSVDASNVVSEVIEIDYDKVFYNPITTKDKVTNTMLSDKFTERYSNLLGYVRDYEVADETLFYVEFSTTSVDQDKTVDELIPYLENCGFIEDSEWSEYYFTEVDQDKSEFGRYTCGVITKATLEKLVEDNYAIDFKWLDNRYLSDGAQYDGVLYSPSELDVYRGTMDEPQYFRENGTPLQGPSLEEYLEENTVSDDRYICVEFHFSKGGKSFDGKIDDVVSYLKDCGYIEDNARTDKNSSDMYSRGVIPYKGLKQLYEDNYALEYIWLYEAAPYDPTLGW